jgi:hypothetical protein
MAVCESCGNDYEPSLAITHEGRTHHFDCFECAIEMLAPLCRHCGTKIIGHGREVAAEIYCCDHCAKAGAQVGRLRDTG